jgi:dihydroxyacid dehydratase/phosphogluconate dehydratase
VVIGDGQVGPKIIGTAEPTMAAAEALGMRLIGRASVTLPATRPARQEHALAFEKPADEA